MAVDLSQLVAGQENTMENYKINIESTAKHTAKTVNELVKTEQKTKYSNTKLIVFAIIICLLLTLTWLLYIYT